MVVKIEKTNGRRPLGNALYAGGVVLAMAMLAAPALADHGVGGAVSDLGDTVEDTTDTLVDAAEDLLSDGNGGNGGTNGGNGGTNGGNGGTNGGNGGGNGGLNGGVNGVGPGGTLGGGGQRFATSCDLLGSGQYRGFAAVDTTGKQLGEIYGVIIDGDNIVRARFLTHSSIFGARRCITITGNPITVSGGSVRLPISQSGLFQRFAG